MRVTQGCFSYLPDLSDADIRTQVQYCIDKGWAVNIEFTDDPHPRNTYWEMWGLPMFDIKDAAAVMLELDACRKVHAGRRYIRPLRLRLFAWLGERPHLLHRRPARGRAGFHPDAQRAWRPGDPIYVAGTPAGYSLSRRAGRGLG